tara:strand:- start:990 stop:1094 length:105 start_codon:yes stop_codon:yes gene_type:complete
MSAGSRCAGIKKPSCWQEGKFQSVQQLHSIDEFS